MPAVGEVRAPGKSFNLLGDCRRKVEGRIQQVDEQRLLDRRYIRWQRAGGKGVNSRDVRGAVDINLVDFFLVGA